jgi:biofilm PGA synthesis N-glycosyltransferase PgaC
MIWEVLFWAGFAVVFVSYAGYPLWVAWLARARPIAATARYIPDSELPRVTCVLAAANEAALIGRKLGMLVRQDYPSEKLAIIVVSDASTDETDRIVAEWSARDPRIRLLRTPRQSGKPTALNLARRHIETEMAVLMDARQELTDGAIRELIAHLADPGVGIASGDLRVKGDSYWTYEGFVRKCESRSGSMVQVTGSLYAIRSEDFPEIPPDTILDDVYVPLTVALRGRRIVMAEQAGSLDVVTRSVGNEFVRKVRTLAGLIQICHTVKGCLNPARNPVWGRFVVHKLSRLACPYGLLVMLAGSLMAQGWLYRLAFAGAVGLGLVALAGRLGLRSRLSSITQSALALNLAALWAVPSYYLGRASVTWARVETDRT